MKCGLKLTNVVTYLIKAPSCVSPYFFVIRSQLTCINTRTNVMQATCFQIFDFKVNNMKIWSFSNFAPSNLGNL